MPTTPVVPVKSQTPAEQEARARLDAIWLLSDLAGRRITRWLFELAGMDAAGRGDPNGALVDVGRRMVGTALRDQLRRRAPEAWLEFERENLELLDAATRQGIARQAENDRLERGPE